MRPALVTGVLAVLGAACGDPFAGGDFLGGPLLTVETVADGGGASTTPLHPQLGILWLLPTSGGVQVIPRLQPQERQPFPMDITFNLDAPPPALVQRTWPLATAWGKASVGVWVLLDDQDGDGTLHLEDGQVAAPDHLWATGDEVLLYLPPAHSGNPLGILRRERVQACVDGVPLEVAIPPDALLSMPAALTQSVLTALPASCLL